MRGGFMSVCKEGCDCDVRLSVCDSFSEGGPESNDFIPYSNFVPNQRLYTTKIVIWADVYENPSHRGVGTPIIVNGAALCGYKV